MMSLPHLILGVLKYGALSGYDLNKAFHGSVQHFWETEQSIIYRALYKMEESGWVTSEAMPQEGAPAKRLYQLTGTGQAELKRWLSEPLPLPALHEGWLGQLFFGTELGKAELRHLLKSRIEMAKTVLAGYENDVPQNAAHYAERFNAPEDMRFWLLTLDYGIQKMRFDIQWAESALALLDGFIDGLAVDKPAHEL